MSGSCIELSKLSLSLRGTRLIAELSCVVSGGEVLSIMGPSGSGKSSLLNLICGNLAPEFNWEGQIRLNGMEITSMRPEFRKVGILFQDDLLFPNMSVRANLAFALPQQIRKLSERNLLAEQALEDSGLAGYGSKDPATLSGGQRSRVALMRSLLANPEVLLLDEPFNKLDASLRQKFRSFVFDHTRRANIPCILVTHDAEDAESSGGRIIRLGD